MIKALNQGRDLLFRIKESAFSFPAARGRMISFSSKRQNMVFGLACILVSAVFSIFSQPNEVFLWGSAFLGLFSLSFSFLALMRVEKAGIAAWLGLIFGSVSGWYEFFWLSNFQDFTYIALAGAVLVYMFLHAFYFSFLWQLIQRFSLWTPFIMALAWNVFEFSQGSEKLLGALAFPWSFSIYPFSTFTPFLQIADITGVWGPNLLVLLIQVYIAIGVEFLFFRRLWNKMTYQVFFRNYGLAIVIALGAVGVYGIFKEREELKVHYTISSLFVQPNMDPWLRVRDNSYFQTALKETQAVLRDYPQIELLVWPEGALYNEYQKQLLIGTLAPEFPELSIVANYGHKEYKGGALKSYNANFFYDSSSQTDLLYFKNHLVPLGEGYPFPWGQEYVENLLNFSFYDSEEHLPVFALTLHDGRKVKFATPICFEDAYPYLFRDFLDQGADFFLNLTDDSWSNMVSAEIQHFVVAYFRAIEFRKTLVRVTNTGITAIVDPHGKITSMLDPFMAGAILTDLNIYETRPTLYYLWGDFFIWGGLWFILILFLLLRVQEFSSHNQYSRRYRPLED